MKDEAKEVISAVGGAAAAQAEVASVDLEAENTRLRHKIFGMQLLVRAILNIGHDKPGLTKEEFEEFNEHADKS